ncbi:MAG: hypothetical protein RSB28_03895 [Oscillospiraceae bacterium]
MYTGVEKHPSVRGEEVTEGSNCTKGGEDDKRSSFGSFNLFT